MTVTLAELLADVNDQVEDWSQEGGASKACDGSTRLFHMPDKGIIDDATFIVMLQDNVSANSTLVPSSDYTMNFNTSWLEMHSASSSDYTLRVNYTHQHWPLRLKTRILNNGLSYLFPKFYAIGSVDLDGDGSTRDFLIETSAHMPIAAVTDVETDTYHLSPFRDYRVVRHAIDAAYLRLFTTPSVGETVTVYYAARPAEFAALADTLEDLGLPPHMRSCLVYYTAWKLLAQKVLPLMRRDLVNSYDNEARTTFNDQMNGINLNRALLELEVNSGKMKPWTAKGI